jgi:hypothetical protein
MWSALARQQLRVKIEGDAFAHGDRRANILAGPRRLIPVMVPEGVWPQSRVYGYKDDFEPIPEPILVEIAMREINLVCRPT